MTGVSSGAKERHTMGFEEPGTGPRTPANRRQRPRGFTDFLAASLPRVFSHWKAGGRGDLLAVRPPAPARPKQGLSGRAKCRRADCCVVSLGVTRHDKLQKLEVTGLIGNLTCFDPKYSNLTVKES